MNLESTEAPADLCLRDAQARMPAFIGSVLDRGARQLAFRAALAKDEERSLALRTAGAMLHKLRRPIARAFVVSMSACLAGGDAPAACDAAGGGLDICLDDGLADRLDLAHLHDAAELSCTAERVRFESLFWGASGSWVVQPGNPIGPEVHARCLATALREWPVRYAVRSAWFMHLGEPLGMELAQFYRALAQDLASAGTREAQWVPPMVAGRRFESWGAAA